MSDATPPPPAACPDEPTLAAGSPAPPPARTPSEIAALLFGDEDGEAPTLMPDEPPPADGNLPAGARAAERPTGVLRPGAELGRYRLEHEIGRGGMGVVYRALDRKLGREVALKVLLVADRVGAEAIDRFQREALSAAALDHPHIVKVLDVGRLPAREGSLPFYTMELVQGEDLAQAIALGHVSPREAVEVARQVALALGYAHGHGILHRDVKPHNILLRSSGSRALPVPTKAPSDAATVAAKPTTRRPTIHRKEEAIHALLLDFGLAKLTETDLGSGVVAGEETVASLTRSGEILGTPVYMPPEQIRSSRNLDARADVYALGATLYHALTGRPPFDQTTLADLLEAVRMQDPLTPASVNPSLDRDLETLCMKCLAKEPRHRYATAEDLAEDCARYLAGEPLAARPVGILGRLYRKARRNRQVARLAVGLAAAVIAVVGLLINYAVAPWAHRRSEAARSAAERADRKERAEALLAACRSALARGDSGAAEETAKRLVQAYTPWSEAGEDLPVAEAHEALARVYKGQGDARKALVELFRAFERVVGTARAAPALVRIGDQLCGMDEVDRAQGVFSRALDERPDAASRFPASLGIARCLAGRCEFDAAKAAIDALGVPREATREERAEVARLSAFLSLVTPTVEVPLAIRSYAVGDVDGDGKPEIAAIRGDGRSVVLGRIDGGRFVEAAPPVQVLEETSHGLSRIEVIDVDGRGGLDVVVGGGVAGAAAGDGRVSVLSMDGGTLRVTRRAAIAADVVGHPFACADLDGDGTRELLVGTSWFDRAISAFRVTAAGLELAWRFEAGGDVWGLLARDADGDGLPEVWAFVGPWNAYDILCLAFDRAKGQFTVRSRTPFAREAALEASCDERGGLSFLVGALWDVESLRPLVGLMGEDAVQRTFRAPGAYEVRLRPDLSPEVVPLTQLPWPVLGAIHGSAARLEGPLGRFAWTAASGLDRRDVHPEEDRGSAVVYCERAGTWEKLLPIRTPSLWYESAQAHDLDGDGDSELVVEEQGLDPSMAGVGALRIHGLSEAAGCPRTGSVARPAVVGTSPSAPLPLRTGSRALLAAREAERLGLPDEAARGYKVVLDAPSSQEDLEEAALGLLAALARQRRVREAADEAAWILARYPRVRGPVQRALLDAADETGEWGIALAAARDLLTTPGLALDEARALTGRERQLAQLAEPETAIDAAGGGLLRDGVDVLATSPLFVSASKDGEIKVVSGTDADDAMFVPVAYDGSCLVASAEVVAERHDWETNLEVGVATGEPWAPATMKQRQGAGPMDAPRPTDLACAFLESYGDSYDPVRHWMAVGSFGGKRRYDWASDLEAPVGARTRVRVEVVPHRREVRYDVGRSEARREGRGRIDRVSLGDERVFLAVLARNVMGAPGHWGVFRVSGLRLDAGSAIARPVAYVPHRAADLLMLANGRWIQGRARDAKDLYDRAIAAADLEASLATELTERKLPCELDARWAERYVKWVPVDARLWRGLLRASLRDAAGAREDLEAAFALSQERASRLLVNAALPLRDRHREAAAVRSFLVARMGLDEQSQLHAFGSGLLSASGGADLAAGLLADRGFEVKPVLVVSTVRDGKGRATIKEGDKLLLYDGCAVRDVPALRKARGAARQAGRRSVTVSVLRRGGTERIEIDPREVSFDVAESWEIVARRR